MNAPRDLPIDGLYHHFSSVLADNPAAAAAGKVVPSEWNHSHIVVSPPGAVLFNDGGQVGASDQLAFDKATGILAVAGNGAWLQLRSGSIVQQNASGTFGDFWVIGNQLRFLTSPGGTDSLFALDLLPTGNARFYKDVQVDGSVNVKRDFFVFTAQGSGGQRAAMTLEQGSLSFGVQASGMDFLAQLDSYNVLSNIDGFAALYPNYDGLIDLGTPDYQWGALRVNSIYLNGELFSPAPPIGSSTSGQVLFNLNDAVVGNAALTFDPVGYFGYGQMQVGGVLQLGFAAGNYLTLQYGGIAQQDGDVYVPFTINAERTDFWTGADGGTKTMTVSAAGVTFNTFACPAAATGAYTLANSGIVFKNAAGAEIFRLWGTDPTIGTGNEANLYIGRGAGASQPVDNGTAGWYNVGVGGSALAALLTGSGNSAFGEFSMPVTTTGTENSGYGTGSLRYNVGGTGNTGLGAHSGRDFGGTANAKSANDTNMVFVGYYATRNAAGVLDNGIAIGAGAQVGASNTAVIGNANVLDVFFGSMAGIAQIHAKNAMFAGQSLTGAAVGSVLDLATTWNTTGSPTAIKLNVTNTLSGAAAKLLDLQVGGVGRMSVDQWGMITLGAPGPNGAVGLTAAVDTPILSFCGGVNFYTQGYLTGGPRQYMDYVGRIQTTVGGTYAWTAANQADVAADTALMRNAAGVVEINNGTAGQFGDIKLRALFASGQNLTGSAGGSVLDLAATWNTTGSPSAIKLSVTNTLSGAGASFFDLNLNGNLQWSFRADSNFSMNWWACEGSIMRTTAGGAAGLRIGRGNGDTVFIGSYAWFISSVVAGAGGFIGFSSGNQVGGNNSPYDANGVYLYRNAPGVVEINNGNAGQFADLKLRSLIYPVPTTDATATGPTTSEFNCGYTPSVVGEVVYLDAAFTWQKADATTKYTGMLGMVLEVKNTGQAMKVALPGSIIYCSAKFAALTNARVYLSETTGQATQVAPVTPDSATRVLGWGVHANKFFFYPSQNFFTHA